MTGAAGLRMLTVWIKQDEAGVVAAVQSDRSSIAARQPGRSGCLAPAIRRMADLEQVLGPSVLGISIVIGLGLQRNVQKGRAEFRRWTRMNPGAYPLRDALSAWIDRVKR
jgi:hypothetical protein